MNRSRIVATGFAAGFLVLSPVAAFADTPAPVAPTPAPSQQTSPLTPAPTESTKPAPSQPAGSDEFKLSVQEGAPGGKLTATGKCDGRAQLKSEAITFNQAKVESGKDKAPTAFDYSGVVNKVKPGKYDVQLICGQSKDKEAVKTVSFT